MSFIKIKTGGNWRLLNGRGAGPIILHFQIKTLFHKKKKNNNNNSKAPKPLNVVQTHLAHTPSSSHKQEGIIIPFTSFSPSILPNIASVISEE
jgi:hypothetical protein